MRWKRVRRWRIGVNHGSLSDRIRNRYGDTPEGIVESCLEFLRICKKENFDLSKKEDAFSKDLLLLMLKQYNLFLESFQFACKNYKGNTNEADIAKAMGFESNDEYNEIMFLREITHTVNAFNDMADIVRLYSKKPEMAEQRLENLLSEVLYEDSDSV